MGLLSSTRPITTSDRGVDMKQRLVVIGNGMAGMRTVEALLETAPDLYEITVFGAEPYGNYNRILLTPVLYGERKMKEAICLVTVSISPVLS